MGKRRGAARARERDYIPFGKPEEVVITYVEAEKVPDGTVIEARYVERFKGVEAKGPSSPNPTPRWEQGDLHPTTCKGKPGIGRTWLRDGRAWCRSCYATRYGEQPPADITVKVSAPRKNRSSLSDLDKLMRRPFGRL